MRARLFIGGFLTGVAVSLVVYWAWHSSQGSRFTPQPSANEEVVFQQMMQAVISASHAPPPTNPVPPLPPGTEERNRSNVCRVDLEEAIRWRRLLHSLPDIKLGDSRESVVARLGIPNDGGYAPRDTLQYTISGVARPWGEAGKTLLIRFDTRGKVRKIERADFLYGPPPVASKESN
jgi:hypothetical protein